MRITNAMMVSGYISNLNKGSEKMNKLQNQISTNKRLSRASDDPIAASKAMEVRTNLSRVKQYKNNVLEANEWLNQTESSLNEQNTLLMRAYELTNSAATATNGSGERKAIADEIEQLSEQLVVSANTSFRSKYVFGGMNTTQKPFEVKEVAGEKVLFYNGLNMSDPANSATLSSMKNEKINYEIGFGTSLDISYNGIDLMGEDSDNTFAVLNNLVKALRTGDETTIENSISFIKDKQDDVIVKIGEVGGKTNRLDFFQQRLDNDEYNYMVMQENTEGIETEKVIMEFKMQEAVYEAALAAGSKVIMQSLTNFLR